MRFLRLLNRLISCALLAAAISAAQQSEHRVEVKEISGSLSFNHTVQKVSDEQGGTFHAKKMIGVQHKLFWDCDDNKCFIKFDKDVDPCTGKIKKVAKGYECEVRDYSSLSSDQPKPSPKGSLCRNQYGSKIAGRKCYAYTISRPTNTTGLHSVDPEVIVDDLPIKNTVKMGK